MKVRLKEIPADLLDGLSQEDQAAIRHAKVFDVVSESDWVYDLRVDGKIELEFQDGDTVHTIWVDPALIV